MRSRLVCLAILFALGSLLLSGCGRPESGKKRVVATTGMIGDLVRRVAGDSVELFEMMGPGVDPHIYEAKESDRTQLRQADLVLYNGFHLEGKMTEILANNPRARAVTAGMPSERLLQDAGQHDPHVWFDVSLWIYALDAAEKHLCELLPARAEAFRKAAADYRAELQKLHEETKREIASVPSGQRVLVTAHDAFRYFGRAYEIEVVGIQGVSTASEAGLKRLEEIADLVVSRKIKTLFPESSVPADAMKKVLERCQARGHTVRLAEGLLYSDAMGDPGTPAGSYPGMVRANVRLIVDSLR